MTKALSREDLRDLVVGATILGTGGGGDPNEGFKILMHDLSCGRKLNLANAHDLDPESLVICAYFCGHIPPPGEEETGKIVGDKEMMKAMAILERKVGKKVSTVIPTEIGGGNTPIALHLASILNVSAFDGDQVGRSAPELTQSSYIIHGIKPTPSIIIDSNGNVTVIEECVDFSSYELKVRSLAIESRGPVFVMDSPVTVKEASKVAICDTVSKAMKLGKIINDAIKSGKNPVDAAVHFLQGFHIFEGNITSHSLKVEQGFLVGEIEIEGLGEWKGHNFRIWVKNENIIGQVNGKVVATVPDLICMVDENCYGITNSKIKIGMKVKIIGVKAPEIWRTPRGIELFGPRHFGFNLEYKPIEKLLKEA